MTPEMRDARDREATRGIVSLATIWGMGFVVWAVLLLCLFGCGYSADLNEETGAPPRLVPADRTVKIYPIADKTLQGTSSAESYVKLGGRLWARAQVSPGGTECAIEITDAPMLAEQREHIIAHERRHCAGQQHVIQKINGAYTTVWLP